MIPTLSSFSLEKKTVYANMKRSQKNRICQLDEQQVFPSTQSKIATYEHIILHNLVKNVTM